MKSDNNSNHYKIQYKIVKKKYSKLKKTKKLDNDDLKKDNG